MLAQILDIRNYVFSVYSLPLFLASIATTAMGAYVLFKIHASHHGFKFFLFTSCLTLWYGSFGMACATTDAQVALWWFKLGDIGVILIPVTNFSFISAITLREKKHRRLINGAYFIAFLFILSVLFSGLLCKGVKSFFWGYYVSYGPLGIPLVFFSS